MPAPETIHADKIDHSELESASNLKEKYQWTPSKRDREKTKGNDIIDSSKRVPAPKMGILGYSYPRSIIVGTAKDIHAFISTRLTSENTRDTLLKIVLNDDPSEKNDSIIVVQQIHIYQYVTLDLTCMDTVLRVTNVHPLARQQMNFNDGNQWTWEIFAKTADSPTSKLKLRIVTEGPAEYEEKTLLINIKVEHNFVRKIYDFLMDNPKTTISILVAVLGFLGKKLWDKLMK